MKWKSVCREPSSSNRKYRRRTNFVSRIRDCSVLVYPSFLRCSNPAPLRAPSLTLCCTPFLRLISDLRVFSLSKVSDTDRDAASSFHRSKLRSRSRAIWLVRRQNALARDNIIVFAPFSSPSLVAEASYFFPYRSLGETLPPPPSSPLLVPFASPCAFTSTLIPQSRRVHLHSLARSSPS